MNLSTVAKMAFVHVQRLNSLSVNVPSGMSKTMDNFMTAGQYLGGGAAGIILVIAGFQLMTGGRNAVEMGKTRIIFLCVGMALIAGCSVIKAFLSGLMAF